MGKFSMFLWLFALACSPVKTSWQPGAVSLTSDCPKPANCTIELLPNKSMVVETTANGIHYSLADDPSTNVIIYKYSKIVKANIQDAGYREEIVFEYNGKKDLTLNDFELQTTKMLFGRFCYCKGETGYFPVKQGRLSIDANTNALLDFTIDQVPQVTKQIRFVLK